MPEPIMPTSDAERWQQILDYWESVAARIELSERYVRDFPIGLSSYRVSRKMGYGCSDGNAAATYSLIALGWIVIQLMRSLTRRSTAMEIKRIGSQASAKGPGDWFTGAVRIDSMFDRTDPARVSGAIVAFEPGARTAWHTHPLGQTLIVTSGCGWAQRDGGPVEEIRPGDVVWFPPGEKHWHGATATTAMTHIAIQEKLNGSPVDWMEKVTDEQYRVT
jgi:quercetin dioxygenase-like cupin family protein